LGQFVTPIEISIDKVNTTVGFELSAEEIEAIFVQLGFETTRNEDILTVMVPSRRKDITIKEDLIEEIARMYGYDEIPSTLPVFEEVTHGALTDRQSKSRVVKATLEGAGLSQAINYSLVDKQRAKDFALQERATIDLLMPMSEAHAT
ncbi:phenylalanine--tRNA ligase subunit beta, partial [Mammaliicoccus fleurettii]